MKIDKLITEIDELVKWYGANHDTTSGELLSSKRDKLSGYLYYLAKELGDANYQFIVSEYNTKKNYLVNLEKLSKVKDENGKFIAVNKCEIEAKVLNINNEEIEAANKGLYNRLKYILEQGNEVLGCIKQRISGLKKERYE